MTINDYILCKITGIQNYGIFVEYQDYQGLIHISEISNHYIEDINKYFSVGEEIYTKILDIDFQNKKLTLSYKKALKIAPKILEQLDIKIGFRRLESKLKEWINEELEKIENES